MRCLLKDSSAVEDEFAVGAAPGGDIDSDGKIHQFFGEISTRGLGLKDNFTAANVPYLANKVYVEVSPDMAFKDIKKYKPIGYPTKDDEIRDLLKKFPPVAIEFDLDQVGGSTENQYVPLEPGHAYFYSATVVIEPVYQRSILGLDFTGAGPPIIDWNFRVTSKSVYKTDLDWFSRQNAEVRYTIAIESTTIQVIKVYETDLKTFIDSLGSAAAVVGAGVILLALWHELTCQVSKQKKIKEELERENLLKMLSEPEGVSQTEHVCDDPASTDMPPIDYMEVDSPPVASSGKLGSEPPSHLQVSNRGASSPTNRSPYSIIADTSDKQKECRCGDEPTKLC